MKKREKREWTAKIGMRRRKNPRIVPIDLSSENEKQPPVRKISSAAKIGRASFSEDLEAGAAENQYSINLVPGSLHTKTSPRIHRHPSQSRHGRNRPMPGQRQSLTKYTVPIAPDSVHAPKDVYCSPRSDASLHSVELGVHQAVSYHNGKGADEFRMRPAPPTILRAPSRLEHFSAGLEEVKRAEAAVQQDAKKQLAALLPGGGGKETEKVLESVVLVGEKRAMRMLTEVEYEQQKKKAEHLRKQGKLQQLVNSTEQEANAKLADLEKALQEEKQAQTEKVMALKLLEKLGTENTKLDSIIKEIEEMALKRRDAEEKIKTEISAREELARLQAEEKRQRAKAEASHASEVEAAKRAKQEAAREKERRLFAEKECAKNSEAATRALAEAEKIKTMREEAERKARKEHAAAEKAALEAEQTSQIRVEALNRISNEAEKARQALEEAREIAKERLEAEARLIQERHALRNTQTEVANFEAEVKAQRVRRAQALKSLQQEKKHMAEIEEQLRLLAERRSNAQGEVAEQLKVEQQKLDEEKANVKKQMQEYQQQWRNQWNQWAKENVATAPTPNVITATPKESPVPRKNSPPRRKLKGSNSSSPVLSSHHSLFELLGTGEEVSNEGLQGIKEGDDERQSEGSLQGLCTECQNPTEGMLPIHYTAAMGHMPCLITLTNKNASNASTFDQTRRSPLFYACANGHGDCCGFLIDRAPQCVQLGDQNGDTPMHAAASAGSPECIRLLIEKGRANSAPTNQMLMSPAHLAKSRECLEVLAGYGADINSQDKQKRTPLFVSCAMNRADCAELLCELLDSMGLEIQVPDRRGDTPLHAAACNGSQDCLLLLLQYGINPVVPNKKGLKPIDLAARRHHTPCEKVLVEYHLHHAAGTDFDSILFFATLEGHRSLKATLGNEGPYEIIKKAPQAIQKDMNRIGSLWSIKRGRSVRLQQFGEWIAFEDQNTEQIYWYNSSTGASQWDMPAEVEHAAATGSRTALNQLQQKASMRLKKVGDWIQYKGAHEKTFYYHETTGDFQWERPADLEEINHERPYCSNDGFRSRERTLSDVNGEWTAYTDPASGHIFWYNSQTQQSQWDRPDEEVTEVISLDDLGV